MSAWYFPSWNGDFRLEAHDDETKTTLTIIEPTEQELRVLGVIEDLSVELGYHDGKKPFWTPGGDKRQATVLSTDILTAGKLLLPKLKRTRAVLTAVKSSDGDIITVRETEKKSGQLDKALKALLKRKDDRDLLTQDSATDPKEEPKALAKSEETKPAKEEPKAVTVARPTPCCPNCQPGSMSPATEVLFDFLTPEERDRWADDHSVVAEGNLSGHHYLLMHRHSRRAQKIGWICFDLNEGTHLHFYDWAVPPEEEVLAAKLILEHHEDWLRNEATCLHRSPIKFKNPFGNLQDGVEESATLRMLGGMARALT